MFHLGANLIDRLADGCTNKMVEWLKDGTETELKGNMNVCIVDVADRHMFAHTVFMRNFS